MAEDLISESTRQTVVLMNTKIEALSRFTDSWQQRLNKIISNNRTMDHSNDSFDSYQMLMELDCHSIKIGNHTFSPKEKVTITDNIRITAPHVQDASKDVALHIPGDEIIRILYNNENKSSPLIFIYVSIRSGTYIREKLGMKVDSGPYYDPVTKIDPYKRITLLPKILTNQMLATFMAFFPNKMDLLTQREATEMYHRTCRVPNTDKLEYTSSYEETNKPIDTEDPNLTNVENNDDQVISGIQHGSDSLEAGPPSQKRQRTDTNNEEDEIQFEIVSSDSNPTADNLHAVITTEPYKILSMEQANDIKMSLERMLKQDFLSPSLADVMSRVRFHRQTYYYDGVLNIWCKNDQTLDWIQKALPLIRSPIPDTQLVVKPQADVERILCTLFVPDNHNTDIKQMLQLLAVQNTPDDVETPSIDIKTWSLVKGERQILNDAPGVLMYLRVPKMDIDILKEQSRRLYYLMDIVFLKVVKDKILIAEAGTVKEELVEDQSSTLDPLNSGLHTEIDIKEEITDIEIKQEMIDVSNPDLNDGQEQI